MARTEAGEALAAGMTTPFQLADELEANGLGTQEGLSRLRQNVSAFAGACECEPDDLEDWAHLSLYFADKLRGGVALALYRRTGEQKQKERAIALLETCSAHWHPLAEATDSHYCATPHVSGETFSWANYQDQVERDVRIANA